MPYMNPVKVTDPLGFGLCRKPSILQDWKRSGFGLGNGKQPTKKSCKPTWTFQGVPNDFYKWSHGALING